MVFNALFGYVAWSPARGDAGCCYGRSLGYGYCRAIKLSYRLGWLPGRLPRLCYMAFRLLVMRDMGVWIGFLATSIWALQWLAVDAGMVGAVYQYRMALPSAIGCLATVSGVGASSNTYPSALLVLPILFYMAV